MTVAVIMAVGMTVTVAMIVTLRFAVAMTVAMIMRMRLDMIAHDLTHTLGLAGALPLGRRIVRVLGMWRSLVEGMHELGPDIGLFRRVIGVAPARAFQMECRRGDELLERGRTALGTLGQRVGAQLLQHIEGMLAGFTTVIKNRHSLVIVPAGNAAGRVCSGRA